MPRAEYFGSDAVEIANLQYREAMVLPESGDCIVQSILTPLDDSTAEFRFASIGANVDDAWRTHMVGVARKADPARSAQTAPLPLDQVRQRCRGSIPVDRYYEALRALGLEYGASFRAIEMLQRGDGEILTRVRLPPHLSADGQSGLHPALLDACLHLYPALVDAYGDFTLAARRAARTYLPVGVERFRCAGARVREVWVHGVRRERANGDAEIAHGRYRHLSGRRSVRRGDRGIVAETVAAGSIEAACHGRNRSFIRASRAAKPARRSQARAAAWMPRRSGSRLREAAGAERRELLIAFVRQEAMKTLGITDTIDAARPLARVGARFADVGDAREPAGSGARHQDLDRST